MRNALDIFLTKIYSLKQSHVVPDTMRLTVMQPKQLGRLLGGRIHVTGLVSWSGKAERDFRLLSVHARARGIHQFDFLQMEVEMFYFVFLMFIMLFFVLIALK